MHAVLDSNLTLTEKASWCNVADKHSLVYAFILRCCVKKKEERKQALQTNGLLRNYGTSIAFYHIFDCCHLASN